MATLALLTPAHCLQAGATRQADAPMVQIKEEKPVCVRGACTWAGWLNRQRDATTGLALSEELGQNLGKELGCFGGKMPNSAG